ncbi:MAG: flagellar basal body P-ring formation chaperone FlgA [Proteobacteria bacterium]|nr:flagellar basal body P-ring formation chaperone FlgA [Pseudomonadota bacterium]
MKNFMLILTLVTVIMAPLTAWGASEVTLRSHVTVESDQITVGDIFDGAGDAADKVIAPAPAPGKSILFKAVSVAKVVRNLGLSWRPATPVRRIKVERLGQTVPFTNISEEIRVALEYEMSVDLFEMELATQQPNIKVGMDQDPSVSVENIYINRKSGQFTAELLAPAADPNGHRFKISGRAHKQTLIPVLTRFIPAGREISEKDIDHKAVRISKTNRHTITDANLVIGKSPRRSIRPGTAIAMNNLGDPVTVEKGKLVSVVLRSGGLFLSVSGRTLEPGGTGQVIRVENINSRKVIQATVINSREVQITSTPQQLAAVR